MAIRSNVLVFPLPDKLDRANAGNRDLERQRNPINLEKATPQVLPFLKSLPPPGTQMLGLLAGQPAIHWQTIALCYLNRIILILAVLTSDLQYYSLRLFSMLLFFLLILFFSHCCLNFTSVFIYIALDVKKTQKKNLLSKLVEIIQPVLLEGRQWSGMDELLYSRSWHSHCSGTF